MIRSFRRQYVRVGCARTPLKCDLIDRTRLFAHRDAHRTDRTRSKPARCTGEETRDDVATRVRRLDTETEGDATTTVGTTEVADATAADEEAVTEADDRGSDANATGRCRPGST